MGFQARRHSKCNKIASENKYKRANTNKKMIGMITILSQMYFNDQISQRYKITK